MNFDAPKLIMDTASRLTTQVIATLAVYLWTRVKRAGVPDVQTTTPATKYQTSSSRSSHSRRSVSSSTMRATICAALCGTAFWGLLASAPFPWPWWRVLVASVALFGMVSGIAWMVAVAACLAIKVEDQAREIARLTEEDARIQAEDAARQLAENASLRERVRELEEKVQGR